MMGTCPRNEMSKKRDQKGQLFISKALLHATCSNTDTVFYITS